MIDLRHGDCLELMRDIPDGSVDLIVADPPYGTTRNRWDSVIPLDKMWEQFRRIAKADAAICIFSQQPFTTELINSNIKQFRYEWVWEKTKAGGFLNARRRPMQAHEIITVFSRVAPAYYPQMEPGEPYKDGSDRRRRRQLWTIFPGGSDRGKRGDAVPAHGDKVREREQCERAPDAEAGATAGVFDQDLHARVGGGTGSVHGIREHRRRVRKHRAEVYRHGIRRGIFCDSRETSKGGGS